MTMPPEDVASAYSASASMRSSNVSQADDDFAPLQNDSIFSKIANAEWFQTTTLSLIVLNALWIGIDVQWNHPLYKEQRGSDHLPLEPVSTVVENLFCFYFTFELSARFLAYMRKCDCLKDRWFVFDGLLVFCMIFETWIMALINFIMTLADGGVLSKFSALRLMRLLRLTRMARLMREVPELLTLVKGMISATKAVSFILMFLVLVMYVWAIIFTAQFGNPRNPENFYALTYDVVDVDPTAMELFGSLGDSMMTLFTQGMLTDNLAQALEAIKDRGGEITCFNITLDENNLAPIDRDSNLEFSADVCEREGGSLILEWLFIAFVIISAFCLLNMLIGVLCEVIQDSAEKEHEMTQIQDLKEHMSFAFNSIDSSNDGMITAAEWTLMKTEPTVRSSMASLGVEPQHMEERLDQLQESLFGVLGDTDQQNGSENRPGLTFDQFIEKVIEIRPDAPASALDVEILRVRVEREEKIFNSRLSFIESALLQLDDDQSTGTKGKKRPLAIKNAKLAELKDVQLEDEQDLMNIPTEVLFAVLSSRVPPPLGQPKQLNFEGDRQR